MPNEEGEGYGYGYGYGYGSSHGIERKFGSQRAV